ncbi:MAG TPA: HlyD family efflux transporter periplasmic adaptor subunit [Candidatus Cybelea sp.]|jgi:multidrug resistance efflux pump
MALCAFVSLAGCGSGSEFQFSGTVQAPSASVGSTIGGRITAVLVQDGAAIRRGDVLVRFDDAQQRAAVVSAQGQVAQRSATLADLQAGPRHSELAQERELARQQYAAYRRASLESPYQVDVLQNQLRQAQAAQYAAMATAQQSRIDASRWRNLYSTGDVSAEDRDAKNAAEKRANADLTNAEAAVRAARAQLASAQRATLPQNTAAALAAAKAAHHSYEALAAGTRPNQIRAARAALAAANGDLENALARLNETVVRSPAAGMVTNMNLHVGDLVGPGAAVATIDESGEPFVRIYVPQSMLGRVRVGASVRVRSDAQAADTLRGTVEAIDSQAQFTPQNVQTAEDRAAVSFGVKVRIHDAAHRLHGGTTAEVALE